MTPEEVEPARKAMRHYAEVARKLLSEPSTRAIWISSFSSAVSAAAVASYPDPPKDPKIIGRTAAAHAVVAYACNASYEPDMQLLSRMLHRHMLLEAVKRRDRAPKQQE